MLIGISLLTIIAGCGAMPKTWTEIPLASIDDTELHNFMVAGYVFGVIECPPQEQCIVADAILLTPKPVPDSSSGIPEGLERLGHDQPSRLGLEVGERYLFYFKRRYGVVKVKKAETL
ncbi:MAG: hypothetical protein KJN72_10505 [Woeseia sp.]|nr:hypothetical protein [Woeseia sp.]